MKVIKEEEYEGTVGEISEGGKRRESTPIEEIRKEQADGSEGLGKGLLERKKKQAEGCEPPVKGP